MVFVVMMVLWIYVCHQTHQVVYIKYMWPLNVNTVHLKVVLKLNKTYKQAENKTCKGKIWYIPIGTHSFRSRDYLRMWFLIQTMLLFFLFLVGLLKGNIIWRIYEFTFLLCIYLSLCLHNTHLIYLHIYLSISPSITYLLPQ